MKSDAAKACEALGIDRSELTAAEGPVEQAVSRYIVAMPFLWLDIDDEPGPDSLRGLIEGNAIALLSNHERTPFDPASLGGSAFPRHVEETHDPVFLDAFEKGRGK